MGRAVQSNIDEKTYKAVKDLSLKEERTVSFTIAKILKNHFFSDEEE